MTRGPWGHVGTQDGSFRSLYGPCGRPGEVTSNLPVTQSADVYVAPMYLRHCAEMKEASLVLTVTGTEGKRVNKYQEEETHQEGRASVTGAEETLLTQGGSSAQPLGAGNPTWVSEEDRQCVYKGLEEGNLTWAGKGSTQRHGDKVTLRARAAPGNSRGRRKCNRMVFVLERMFQWPSGNQTGEDQRGSFHGNTDKWIRRKKKKKYSKPKVLTN